MEGVYCMKVYFVRHGKTLGNIEGRYVGKTDLNLEDEGKKELEMKKAPKPDALYVSPLIRCIETCNILFPYQYYTVVDDIKEIDFGDFEGKTFKEVEDNEIFKEWKEQHGPVAFINGESMKDFQIRCMKGFKESIRTSIKAGHKVVTFVVHGGTIMALLDALSIPHKNYHEWAVNNGCGYVGDLEYEGDNYVLNNLIHMDYL